jgi:hypothetical protein
MLMVRESFGRFCVGILKEIFSAALRNLKNFVG